MRITTKRLVIEEATISDAPFYFQLLNSPSWIRYIGDRGIYTVSDAEKYIRNSLIRSYRELGYGLFKVSLQEGTPIGVCGFLSREYLDHPDIGYALMPDQEGKGYMLEAAQAMMTYGRESLGLTTIYAFTDTDNSKSHQLLQRLGFTNKEIIHPPGFDDPCVLFQNTKQESD